MLILYSFEKEIGKWFQHRKQARRMCFCYSMRKAVPLMCLFWVGAVWLYSIALYNIHLYFITLYIKRWLLDVLYIKHADKYYLVHYFYPNHVEDWVHLNTLLRWKFFGCISLHVAGKDNSGECSELVLFGCTQLHFNTFICTSFQY